MAHLLKDRYPQDVVDFCELRSLADKLDLVVDLVEQAFPDAQRVIVGMEQDPESDQRWILVDALVGGPAKEVGLRHRDCVRQLLHLLPWPTSTLIRTTYTLA